MATVSVQTPTQHSFAHEVTPTTSKTRQKNAKKQDVNAILEFHKPNEDGSPPTPAYVGKPETYQRPSNPQKVTVHDVSGDEARFNLDSHGFQFVSNVSQEKDFLDEEQIKNNYYKEVDQLLKDSTGAHRTFIFDHTIRRPARDPTTPEASLRGPVRRVHIDQSYTAALSRVPHHLPDDAETLLQGRVRLINVWRPIKTVRRDPLAVAQSQSVAEDDLAPIGLIYPDRKGETLGVKFNAEQRWFYKSQQRPDEALLIKCFDNWTGEGGRFGELAKRVPHTSFEVPGTENEEGRESIEVRALVFG